MVSRGLVLAAGLLLGGAPAQAADVAGIPFEQFTPGEDFYQALLRIWPGDSPVHDDLKLRLPGRQV